MKNFSYSIKYTDYRILKINGKKEHVHIATYLDENDRNWSTLLLCSLKRLSERWSKENLKKNDYIYVAFPLNEKGWYDEDIHIMKIYLNSNGFSGHYNTKSLKFESVSVGFYCRVGRKIRPKINPLDPSVAVNN